MKIIFCADPIHEENPDAMYIDEVAAASRAGLEFKLIHYEALVEKQNAARAVRDIPAHENLEHAVYRGWMLRAEHYSLLYDALMSRGLKLINSPSQYEHCQHLPKSYPLIKAHTAHSVWMETDGKQISYDIIMQLLLPFAGEPVILKDYVKSEKHYWHEACYISSASDPLAVRNTVNYFLRLRGKDLEGGLVFREFLDLEALSLHPRSGMPLSKEYRVFYLHGLPILTLRYWDMDGYEAEDEHPPLDQFEALAKHIRSPFFTMDLAKRSDGEWLIIELGDAQVAGLPISADMDLFYRALAGGQ